MSFKSFVHKAIAITAITVAIAFLEGCATTGNENKATPNIVPASTLLEGVKRVAVLDFQGYEPENAGMAVTGDLIDKLQKMGRFDVLERDQIKQILTEHAYSMSGVIDITTAKEIGKLLGADALIMGNVLAWASEDQHVMKDDYSTLHQDQNTKAWVVDQTPHMDRRAYVKVSIRVANVETGVIQTAGALDKRITQQERMTTSSKNMRTKDELLQDCVSAINTKFVASLALPKVTPESPTASKKPQKVTEPTNTPENKSAPQKGPEKIQLYVGANQWFKEAPKFAVRKLWPEAKELWEKALAESQGKNKMSDVGGAHYDLGLNYVANFDFAKAETEFRAAYDADSKDNYLDRLADAREQREIQGTMGEEEYVTSHKPSIAPADTTFAHPEKIQYYIGASKYFKDGSKYASRKLWPEAREMWDKALGESQDKKRKNDISGAYYDLGIYYEAVSDFVNAEKEYKAAYEFDARDNILDRLAAARTQKEAIEEQNPKPKPKIGAPSDSLGTTSTPKKKKTRKKRATPGNP